MRGGFVSIRELVAQGFYQEALAFYTQLRSSGFLPNHFTFPCLLKACAKAELSTPSLAQQLHTHVVKSGHFADTHTATALTLLYMKLGLVEDALKVFERMPNRTLASFNALVTGFSQSGSVEDAFLALKWIGREGLVPNSVTLASALSACEDVKVGRLLHGFCIKVGCESDVYAGTAILTMYAKCKETGSALRVFRMMPHKTVITCNSLMSGLLHNGFARFVFDIFAQMSLCLGESPSSVTWITLLCSCSELSALHYGRQIHCSLVKHEVNYDVQIGTALVDMYSKCGSPKCAFHVFERLKCKNLLTWNSMISGVFLYGQSDIALELFHRLQSEGLKPDMATWNAMISGFSRRGNGVSTYKFFNKMQVEGETKPSLKSVTSLLAACSALSDLKNGKVVHGYTIRMSFDDDQFLLTALIDMYMKCGCHCPAFRIFYLTDVRLRDAAMWNVMIDGYGRNGEDEMGLNIFHQMLNQNVEPNSATLLCVLSAFDHTGQVEKALDLFRRMSSDFGIAPSAQHFSCIIDILGRAGRLKDAQDLMKDIPLPSTSVYASLLGSCRIYSDSELGKEMAIKLHKLEPADPIPLVILSQIYAETGKWEEVELVREMLKKKGLQKDPGCSWIV